jgi:hypothetical protein
MTAYEEYPKWLKHPGEAPARISDDWANGPPQVGQNIGFHSPAGKPAQFPPVLVNSREQEEMYEARGYTAGPMSAAAAQTARAAPIPAGYSKEEYPRIDNGMVVQDPSKPPPSNEYPKWCRRDGVEKIVHSREEEDRLFPPIPPKAPAPPESEWEFPAPDRIGDTGRDREGRLWIWVAVGQLLEVKLPLAHAAELPPSDMGVPISTSRAAQQQHRNAHARRG